MNIQETKPIKLLIVDDSLLIRKIIKELVSDEAGIEVVGEAEDPLQARELIKRLNPDILTLDIEMPKMDGITFLRNLMRLRPMPVLMLSTLTTKGADITLEALSIGAIDFIAKPNFSNSTQVDESFRRVLVDKIKQVSLTDKQCLSRYQTDIAQAKPVLALSQTNEQHLVAIGASTGGTEAIKEILQRLPKNTPPIVIAQHIPEKFSLRFAARLDKECQLKVCEAEHNQELKQGHVYIAPGGKHLVVERRRRGFVGILSDADKVNRHRPSVDVLFESLIPFAEQVHGIILTGMGNDGAQGLLHLKQKGAITTVQSKSSSIIWGMPGQAYKINAHTYECHLVDIAEHILKSTAVVSHYA